MRQGCERGDKAQRACRPKSAGHTLWVLLVKKSDCRLFCSGSFSLAFGGSGFCFCGCRSCFCFLLGYGFCLSFVLGFFCFKTLLCFELCAVSHRRLLRCYFCVFFSFPSGETTFCLCLVECTLGDTALKMLHQKHALVGEDCAYCIGGLCTDIHPIQSPFEVKSNCSRISVRIIRTYPFNKSTIG